MPHTASAAAESNAAARTGEPMRGGASRAGSDLKPVTIGPIRSWPFSTR